MRILLIEDDERLARLIGAFFEHRYYRVDLAHDGDIGLEMALSRSYEVAIIDWMMPYRDGPAICRAIRNARVQMALLMLTARSQIEDRIAGLDNGADDYLSKPFDLEELSARVRAVSRRYQSVNALGSDTMEMRCGDITMDIHAHTARRGNISLNLTSTEWDVLEYLMRHPKQVLSREQIYLQVWSPNSQAQVTIVDLYISYLRHKLNNADGSQDPIETVRGLGYRMRDG
jgi:two-component system OmpR family response regulator